MAYLEHANKTDGGNRSSRRKVGEKQHPDNLEPVNLPRVCGGFPLSLCAPLERAPCGHDLACENGVGDSAEERDERRCSSVRGRHEC